MVCEMFLLIGLGVQLNLEAWYLGGELIIFVQFSLKSSLQLIKYFVCFRHLTRINTKVLFHMEKANLDLPKIRAIELICNVFYYFQGLGTSNNNNNNTLLLYYY